ncbi:DUF1937 family protein [Pararhodobacter zhoushanensis]|uniref:DUF1937 family protein n=1 Tax=Pararhodobacter zhoushanensis TaxID=2479545 RepID=A0ABT3GYJ2_9RHOB|nr:DUF1937 family protein [Pararhodobacter zhoushanensis]MCW1932630.1 DUF1937 family protein [Pararhodobacter zhoushanensis]
MIAPDAKAFWATLRDHPAVRFGVTVEAMAMVARGQVYLATPYTRLAAPTGVYDPARAEDAAALAAQWQRWLAMRGVTAVSPIVQSQAVTRDVRSWKGGAAAASLALDAAFWTRWCAPMLDASSAIYVPCIAGWRDSDGIRHEVESFVARPRPVYVAGWP